MENFNLLLRCTLELVSPFDKLVVVIQVTVQEAGETFWTVFCQMRPRFFHLMLSIFCLLSVYTRLRCVDGLTFSVV